MKLPPGGIGSWVMCGTPSIAFGRRCPWKWIPVVSAMLFLKIARTLSPSTTSIRGPGHVALNPRASISLACASILCLIGSTVSSKTLVSPSSLGSSGWLPVPSIDALSPPRNRSTTASAAASWSMGGLALGAGDADAWSIDGAADADGAALALADGAPTGPSVAAASPGA